MKRKKRLKAVQKRAEKKDSLRRFAFGHLERQLPLTFPKADVPEGHEQSPKRRYRSHYEYQGSSRLRDMNVWRDASPFTIATYLFDFSNLEPLLAAHLYRGSAKGQVPFHPVSMYLLILYRRQENLSRPEVLRRLRDPEEGRLLRQLTGFEKAFPSESGLRYVESRISPQLQQEINALQIDTLFQAGLLPTRPQAQKAVTLSFDGMLHQARSRMRCACQQRVRMSTNHRNRMSPDHRSQCPLTIISAYSPPARLPRPQASAVRTARPCAFLSTGSFRL